MAFVRVRDASLSGNCRGGNLITIIPQQVFSLSVNTMRRLQTAEKM